MKNMFAYPSMDGQHDGITIFFFLWRCKYSVPSFLIIPAASISLNRKEIGGTISVHIRFVSIFQNHGKTVMSGPTIITPHIERQIRVLQIERCVPRLFFLIILQKNDNQPYKKKIKTIVRWFQIHIFVTESKITEEVCLPTRKKYWKMHYGYSPK